MFTWQERFPNLQRGDSPAKPPCLSLSHFGGHDQVPNRTRSSRTHLDIFLWRNVPWISLVHPGAIGIDHRHSVRCSTRPMLTPVRTVLFVFQPCMKQFKIRSCMLQSVTVQVRCTSALTVRTPSSPGFVEWSMPSDAWVDTTELSGEKKKEQSPDTVMEEPAEPAPGAVIAQVGQQDGKGSIGTEGRYHKGRDTESCPCHDGTRGEYRSDRETSRTGAREEYRSYRETTGTSRKGKGIGDGETRIRNSHARICQSPRSQRSLLSGKRKLRRQRPSRK